MSVAVIAFGVLSRSTGGRTCFSELPEPLGKQFAMDVVVRVSDPESEVPANYQDGAPLDTSQDWASRANPRRIMGWVGPQP